MTTDSARAEAERWLQDAFYRAAADETTGPRNYLGICARIAADFAERLADIVALELRDDRDDCYLGCPGYPPVPEGHIHPHPKYQLPWAEAMKDAGEEPGK